MPKKAVKKKISNLKKKEIELSDLTPQQRKRLSDRVSHLNYRELNHVKVASAGFVLFLLSVWPELREVLMSAHWGWYLGLAIAFSIKPIRSFWFIPRE
jgi:hypothetical protein